MKREVQYLVQLDHNEREALKNILAPGYDALLDACREARWWMEEERKAHAIDRPGRKLKNPALDKCIAALAKAMKKGG